MVFRLTRTHLVLVTLVLISANLALSQPCVQCLAPKCNCGNGFYCRAHSRTCRQCPYFECVRCPSCPSQRCNLQCSPGYACSWRNNCPGSCQYCPDPYCERVSSTLEVGNKTATDNVQALGNEANGAQVLGANIQNVETLSLNINQAEREVIIA